MDAYVSPAIGIVPRDVVAAMSGLDFLTGLRDAKLATPPFSVTADIRPLDLEAGRVVFEGIPSERFYNPMGAVHGGWIATLLDTAMACAIHSALSAGHTLTTLELKTNFIRPVFGSTGKLRCEGVVLSLGGRIASAEGRVYDPESNLIAHGSETCLIMKLRSGAEASAVDRGVNENAARVP